MCFLFTYLLLASSVICYSISMFAIEYTNFYYAAKINRQENYKCHFSLCILASMRFPYGANNNLSFGIYINNQNIDGGEGNWD